MKPTTNDSPPPQAHHTTPLTSNSSTHKYPTSSQPPRALLILQHGFGEYATRYTHSHSRLIPTLTAHGFEVWALDLRGHGTSPGERGVVDLRLAVEDHLELRRQAAERGLPVFLLGHSLGGLVTAGSVLKGTEAAAEVSLRVDGLILTSPVLPAMMPAPVEYAVGLLGRFIPTVQSPFPRSPAQELCRDAEQVRLAREDEGIYKGQISFLVAATALREARAVWTGLGRWTTPTLVVHGTDDAWADARQSERLVEGIASADKTLHLVQGGYHELLNDGDGVSKQTLQLILSWLESRVA